MILIRLTCLPRLQTRQNETTARPDSDGNVVLAPGQNNEFYQFDATTGTIN